MIDDLISRERAINAVKHALAKGLEHSQYIEIIPSVPAVPLDKLCELCEETKARVPCVICEKIMPEWCAQHNKPTLTGRDWWDCPAWKQILTKWMEEQDAIG